MMDTLRVSATDIDALRYFLADEEAELADLLARLRREEEPTESMRIGTALHAALEACEPGEFGELKADGYIFEIAADGEVELPATRELKATRDYVIDGCVVTVVGKVDALDGRRVDDHKWTGRFDPERFMASYQWRIYLDLFGADEFRWNVFEGRQDRDDPRRVVVCAVHLLRMHRYPGIGGDIERELRRFVEFARQHLPERIGQADMVVAADALADMVEEPKRPKPMARKAALLCKEASFQRFLDADGEDEAAVEVRRRCGVTSRADIDGNSAAEITLRNMEADYRNWLAGLDAAARQLEREAVAEDVS